MDKSQKAIFCIGGGIVIYFVLTFLMGLPVLLANPEPKQVLALLPQFWYMKAGISCLCAILLTWLMGYSLDDISSKKVGQGQHGTARWATEDEIREAYTSLPYGKEFYNLKKLSKKMKDGAAEWTKKYKPGFVIGFEKGRWLVDTSDNNALLTAPPGAGKTKRMYIPTIFYNALVNWLSGGKGASMILTDCKGELVQKCGTFLKLFGYRVLFLNFKNPLASFRFNLMANINKHMDDYKAADTENKKLQHYGSAERYAKILAASIVDNMGDTQKSDSGSYFTETSKGLLTGMILLVSEYGGEKERHIISVFRLIIELNGLTEDSTQANQISRMQELLTHVGNDRIKNYVGPATSADVRTSMNVFSSALGKLVQFIDAELEPMVCGHSNELNDIDFIKYPTAIFLVCPDSNTTRHFFASLFIRYMMNDLIDQADNNPSLTLDRQVLDFWDEFGNMPPIKDVDTLLSAARSRGIRFLLSLQSHGQLEKSYSKTMTKIIMDCCQIIIVTYVSPNAKETAEDISKALGSRTAQSGSVTHGKGRTQNLQMIERRLLTIDEIMRLKQGDFIIIRSGGTPVQTKLPMYWDYIPEYDDFDAKLDNMESLAIICLTADKIRLLAQRETYKLTKGMFL